MTRVPDLDPGNLTPEQKRISDEIASVRGGFLRGPFAIWIRIPEIAHTANQFGNALRLHGKLDRSLFELAIAIIARDWSAQYEWFAHQRRGLEAGLSAEIYEALRTRRVPKFASEEQKLVYELVNELVQTKTIGQESYDRAVKTLGLENVIELVTDVGFYTTVAMMLNVFDYSVPESVKAGRKPLS